MPIDIEALSDDEKENLITQLQSSLKKSKKKTTKSTAAVTPTVTPRGSGSMASTSIAERRRQQR